MAALMRSRLLFAMAGLLFASVPAHADPVDAWRAEIASASARFGVPVSWVEAVMRAESGGHTHMRGRPTTSSAGAMGLMQLMPGTWSDMRIRHDLGTDPHDPHDNIMGGTAYLAAMHARFGYPGLFGAYHAGPARYADFVRAGRPLPHETIAYMAAVTASLAAPGMPLNHHIRAPLQPPLFVIRGDAEPVATPEDERPAEERVIDPLFALRRRF